MAIVSVLGTPGSGSLYHRPRCPFCNAFLPAAPNDPDDPAFHRCNSCGTVNDLRASRPFSLTVAALSPNGKLYCRKLTVKAESGQLSLFGGA